MERITNGEAPKLQGAPTRTIRFASLVLVVVTIVALGAVAYFTERGIVARRDSVIHTYQVCSQLEELQLELMRAKSDETTYLLIRNKNQIPRSRRQAELARQSVGFLRKLTRDNPVQQARIDQLAPQLNQQLDLIETQPPIPENQPRLSLREENRQDQIRDREKQINAIIQSMQDEEQSLLTERLTAWNYLFKRNVLMLALAFAVVAVMLAYNFWLLITEVSKTKDREKKEQANAESYRLMSAKILELQDSERRRIARELHDSVGQFLVGLKINLSQLENGSRVDSAKLVKETIELTDYTIQEVRTISHLLHPPLLEELGFLSAARWYVDEYGKRSQVRVALEIAEPIERLPRAVEIALFRVLQETLTNVYRHSGARTVDVQIKCHDGHVCLTVADDGKGIPQEVLSRFYQGAAPGIGLAGMRERLAEFGGQMNVHSSSAGSVVEATIPTAHPVGGIA
jgi:signal transduction histidine kinase